MSNRKPLSNLNLSVDVEPFLTLLAHCPETSRGSASEFVYLALGCADAENHRSGSYWKRGGTCRTTYTSGIFQLP